MSESTSLKAPELYIENSFMNKQQRSLHEIPQYKRKYACELAEGRFIDILSKPASTLDIITGTSNYQKGILITQQGEPRAILKKYYQDLILPFTNHDYREGIYWLDKKTYAKAKKIELQKGQWGRIDVKKLDLFPVRPLQGAAQQTLRELLEEEYQNIKTNSVDQAYQTTS